MATPPVRRGAARGAKTSNTQARATRRVARAAPAAAATPPAGEVAPVSAAAVGSPPGAAPTAIVFRMAAGAERGDATRAPRVLSALPGQDVVAVTLANGLSPDVPLFLSPEDARDLFLAQAGPVLARGGVGAPAGEVPVPAQARWRSMADAPTSRGALSDLVFKSVDVLGLSDLVAAKVAALVRDKIDGQVEEAVYRLLPGSLGRLKGSDLRVERLAEAPADQASLVLIHGTFVDTVSTFQGWWEQHGGLVDGLFRAYGGRVYALDHRTVGASPIENALTLAKACPPGARLHLVTHSRGGLVAEVLAKVCGLRGQVGPALSSFAGADYEAHRQALTALGQVVAERGLQVDRVVRVACPAHGTLLASRRLSAYLSVLAWLLEKAGGPLGAVAGALVDFAKAVVQERTQPEALPGIEAMMPGRPLTTWLNQRQTAVPGSLRVVAGDLQGDSMASWLKVLLSDGFYWTDNDLVVNTNAMYGGSSRQDEATFLLERSGSTDHFHYFRNDSTAQAIQQALLLAAPPGFLPIGPLSRSGLDASGERGLFREDRRIADATARALKADGRRPAVLVLPGILGSRLKSAAGREWFALLKLPGLMDRIAWQGEHDAIVEDGPLPDTYADLVEALERSHDVIGFGFDWRRPLEMEARRLASCVRAELARREASAQPVTVLAHSMGGLLLRCLQLVDQAAWQALVQQTGARLVMLGTPNGGSWSPMTILSGDDSFGAGLTAVAGFPFGEQRQRQHAAEMPGLMQLQAGLTDRGLDRQAAWQELAERDLAAARQAYAWHLGDGAWHQGPCVWAVPPQAVLDQAVALRRRLDAQPAALREVAGKMAVVLGQAPETPDGIRWEAQGTLAYTTTPLGDGRVTWASAQLPGVATYAVAAVHGDLPKAQEAFELYRALLLGQPIDPRWQHGLPVSRGGAEADGVRASARPAHRPGALAPAARGGAVALDDLLRGFGRGAGREGGGVANLPPVLQVRVVHGDVASVAEPILMGHTRSMTLTGAEKVVDRALGGVLGTSLRLREYPEEPGQQEIFVNSRSAHLDPDILLRPRAAIVVGLGDEGDPTLASVRKAVRSGVLAYARHLWRCEAERQDQPPALRRFELAALLLGSGSSVSVRDAACALVGGVLDANQDLSERPPGHRWPLVGELKVVDLYLDRASEAWRTLNDLADSPHAHLQLAPAIEEWASGRARPPGVGYRGAAHDLVRVSLSDGGPTEAGGTSAEARLEYSMFTRRARSEVRGKSTQAKLVAPMLTAAQGQTAWNAELARSLYRLLLPQELQLQFSAGNALLLELDPRAAAYPWELLDDGPPPRSEQRDIEPLTLRREGGLLRKLRLSQFRRRPADALVGDRMVVIGVPHLSDERYPPLPAAADEAMAVAEVLGVTPVLDAPPMAITTAVLARPCRLLHLAGHGQHDPSGLSSGLVMDAGSVLGPREFDSMEVVPELVFINCCHLGHIDGAEPMQRHLFAANVAEQLMRNGVLCVVAAGWAVRDAAASAFARAFYRALLGGQNFQAAVAQARRAAYEADPDGNTWAAYQCYGDPDWRLRPARDSSEDPNLALTRPLPEVPSKSEMVLLVEELRQQATRADMDRRQELLGELDRLVAAQRSRFATNGQVLEAIGMAYQSLHRKELALDYLERACGANDGRASLKAREQWLNMRARLARSVAELEAPLAGLAQLNAIGETAERWSLVGSTWKRWVLLTSPARRQAVRRGLTQMRQAFEKSGSLSTGKRHFPLSQCLAASLRLHWLDHTVAAPTADELEALKQAVKASQAKDLEFWDLVAGLERTLLAQLCARARQQAKRLDLTELMQGLALEHQRHAVPHAWESVYDNARFLLEGQAALAGWTAPEQAQVSALLAQLKDFAQVGGQAP